MKTFVLIIAFLTQDGNLEVRNYGVNECPDNKAELILSMNELVNSGFIKSWKSVCVQNGRKA